MTLSRKVKERIWTVAFMFLVTLVSMSAVSALALATRERVEHNAALFLQRAVLEAAGLAAPAEPEALRARFEALARAETNAAGRAYYRVLDSDGQTPAALVFVRSGPGLWGAITAVVGVRPDFSALTGVTFTDQNETPGLGARIAEPWFKAQFRGKRAPLRIVPEGSGATDPEAFDGITGATITTAAVRDILNRVLAEGAGAAPSAPAAAGP